MFVGEPFLRKGCPHTPSQKLSHNNYLNKFVSIRIDSRRERTARFCYRKKSGATETLISKRVVSLGKK